MNKREPIEPDDTVALLLTPAERDAAVSLEVFLPDDLERKLQLGVSKGARLEFPLTLDDLDELQGCVAAAANHTKSRKLQRTLDAVFDKIQKLLDRYTDEEE
jgi:hypothetical protein